MQYVNWSDAFLTGHHAIDADHKKLFSLIGDLYGYVAAEAAASRLESALDELVDYVHAHFAREEQLLQSTAYPDLENHKAAHAMLRQRILAYQAAYLADPSAFDFDAFMQYLLAWLKGHILETDMAYVLHLVNNDGGNCDG